MDPEWATCILPPLHEGLAAGREGGATDLRSLREDPPGVPGAITAVGCGHTVLTAPHVCQVGGGKNEECMRDMIERERLVLRISFMTSSGLM
jgi:hypothetical protein